MNRFINRILAVLIGGLFLYAGALKALDPAAFANDVFHYRILPWEASVVVAFYLPWLEIVCGAALIVRRGFLAALGILSTLMLVFVTAIISANLRGIDVSCGCFGSQSHASPLSVILLRDGAILAGLGVLIWRRRENTDA